MSAAESYRGDVGGHFGEVVVTRRADRRIEIHLSYQDEDVTLSDAQARHVIAGLAAVIE